MLPINTSRAVVKSTLVARDERGVNKTNGKVSKQNLDCLHSYDFVHVPEFPGRQRFRRLGRGRETRISSGSALIHGRLGRLKGPAMLKRYIPRECEKIVPMDMRFVLSMTGVRNDTLLRIVRLESNTFL
jgi:hypothetical protein